MALSIMKSLYLNISTIVPKEGKLIIGKAGIWSKMACLGTYTRKRRTNVKNI